MTPSFHCIFVHTHYKLYAQAYYDCDDSTFYQIRNAVAQYANDNGLHVMFIRGENILNDILQQLETKRLTYCYGLEYDNKNNKTKN
jgi:hypothetical protein